MDIQQAGGQFTQSTIAKYNEMIEAPSFLSALFKPVLTATKYVSIQVKRGTEKIAVEVQRGTEGNPNDMSKVTQKTYFPRFFDEKGDITELEGFNAANVDNPPMSAVADLSKKVSEMLFEFRSMIDRAKELMAAQVLETGVVITRFGESINYQRKAASLVDNSANPWTTATTNVEAQLISGADFIREEGHYTGGLLDLIMSGEAWVALQSTNYFKDKADFNNVKLITINEPKIDARGAVYHGRITAGSYVFNVWTYDQSHIDDTNTRVRYTDAKKAVMIPNSGADFIYAHGGIVYADNDRIRVAKAQYVEYSHVDTVKTTYDFGIKSSPLPVPVTIDMIYTMQILGDGNPVVE